MVRVLHFRVQKQLIAVQKELIAVQLTINRTNLNQSYLRNRARLTIMHKKGLIPREDLFVQMGWLGANSWKGPSLEKDFFLFIFLHIHFEPFNNKSKVTSSILKSSHLAVFCLFSAIEISYFWISGDCLSWNLWNLNVRTPKLSGGPMAIYASFTLLRTKYSRTEPV